MSEEQEKKKPKKRRTATKAAASIGPMVKALIGNTLTAKEEGKHKLAFTFICCSHEEIFRAMDVIPV